ncbi:hypothetical protein GCM10023189_50530 [Nibrella saemangeumensis]|uniref:Uncharacterized protein n=1 Tax=Nibrella saemangeumensis TaxID=1084526 RepID=A0ABP8NJ33_9BACT
MELDDLKQAWNQANQQPLKTPDIMNLIHHKSKGPIASLKTAFRKQMLAVGALMAAVIATQAQNVSSVSSHLLFWTYMGFCLGLLIMLYLNYRLTHQMESMDTRVKDNLEQHVIMLEQRLKWQNIGARLVIVFFILLLEVIPYYQSMRMLDTWHGLSPVVRFSSYAAYLVFQYFLSRTVAKNKFGKHLDRLKHLLNELR